MQNPEHKDQRYKPGNEIPIGIGELVFPFSHPACENLDRGGSETRFCLGINFAEKNIKLRISTHVYDTETNGMQITPFDPEKGYIITADDLNLEKRGKKLREAIRRFGGFGIDPEFPLSLVTEIDSDYFVQDGLAVFQEGQDYDSWKKYIEYKPNIRLLLDMLRCRAITGDMTFESKLIPNSRDLPNEVPSKINTIFENQDIYCGDFYPLDTGPLASDSHGTYSQEDDGSDLEIGPGHELFFANDPKQIAKIGIEFVVASMQLLADDNII